MVKMTDSAKVSAAGPGLIAARTLSCTSDDRIATTNTSIIDQRPMNSTISKSRWRRRSLARSGSPRPSARKAMARNLPTGIITLATNTTMAMPQLPPRASSTVPPMMVSSCVVNRVRVRSIG